MSDRSGSKTEDESTSSEPSATSRRATLLRSAWAFPIALLILTGLATALRVHGSSIGVYHSLFFGPQSDDPALILGDPEGIRSDEWLVIAQYTTSQHRNGFPRVNPDLGNGQDMSVVIDVPYRDWSVLFKPQNLGFFVLPLEHAFALKWWFLGLVLLVSCYLLVLELVPGRRWFAGVIAFGLFFSPFVQWWYLTITLAPLAYSLLGLTIVIKLQKAATTRARWIWGLALAYTLAAFALVLYPPFQIACAIAAGAFAVAYLIERGRSMDRRTLVRLMTTVLLAGMAAGAIVMLFLETREDVIATVANTVYPGTREAPGGQYDLVQLFSSHLVPLLQWPERAAGYVGNQSEASNFLVLSPFLLVPSAYFLARRWRRHRTIDLPLLFVNAAIIVVIIRMVTPAFDGVFRLLLLHRVPSSRLLIGLGLLGILQVVSLYRHALENGPPPAAIAWVTAAASLVAFLYTGFHTGARYPAFVTSPLLIVGLALAASIIVFLLSRGRFLLGATILALFALGSIVRIHPLYVGLDPLVESRLAERISAIGDERGAWVVLDDIAFENFPLQRGLHSYSGVYAYPQLELWRRLDPDGSEAHIYNRYAHVTFTSQLPGSADLRLNSPDWFTVRFDACSPFVQDVGIAYALSPTVLEDPCLTPIEEIVYPERTFYIYRVMAPAA